MLALAFAAALLLLAAGIHRHFFAGSGTGTVQTGPGFGAVTPPGSQGEGSPEGLSPDGSNVTFGEPPQTTWFYRLTSKGWLSIQHLMPDLHVENTPFLDIPQNVQRDCRVPYTKRQRSYSYSTNSRGLRGQREFEPRKADGVYRIGVLGTGVSFGFGVNDDETYAVLLDEILAKRRPGGRTFEVVNFSRPALLVVEAVTALEYWAAEFDVDLWIIAVGVNDALPCFRVQFPEYKTHWEMLLEALEKVDAEVIVAVEPANTFYPWYRRYKRFDTVMREVVAPRFPMVDLASYLDCEERKNGLRLDRGGSILQILRYTEGVEELVHVVRERPSRAGPAIPAAVYDYLDGTDLSLATFITDCHLNENGHRVVAEALARAVEAKLSGAAELLPVPPECGLR